MNLARVIRLDESDPRVMAPAAEPGEWAISGAFEFTQWREDDLQGPRAQAFANGWLGLESFGRATLVAVTPVTEGELTALTGRLTQHFLTRYDAPDEAAARSVAEEELAQMRDLCDGQEANTILVVERALEEIGVRERVRVIQPSDAPLSAIASHGS
ncbi:hypothetical protein D6850_16990 [Roseovarius spongiae]|uniref:Uncharacterized protein n=1 Tax=Roseovarius spongiae TaxID=2320272 RepID=A0A3A8B3Y9_9RHOB|nr:DUF6505 family protein [Roseovarius spongiae]RKF12654.1 hypothetical protein D6850_16990 [Roseovarius spongiae]